MNYLDCNYLHLLLYLVKSINNKLTGIITKNNTILSSYLWCASTSRLASWRVPLFGIIDRQWWSVLGCHYAIKKIKNKRSLSKITKFRYVRGTSLISLTIQRLGLYTKLKKYCSRLSTFCSSLAFFLILPLILILIVDLCPLFGNLYGYLYVISICFKI